MKTVSDNEEEFSSEGLKDESETNEDLLNSLLSNYTEKVVPPSLEELTEETTEEIQEEKPKGKRGRKPGSRNKSVEENESGEIVIDSSFISGAMALMFFDFLFPEAIAFVYNLKKPKIKMKAEDLQIDEKQLKKLEPLAEKVIDKMKITLHPGWFLMISMFGIYFINMAKFRTFNNDSTPEGRS
jgi:hypothetical protein